MIIQPPRIERIGNENEDAPVHEFRDSERFDCGGRCIVPGLIDSHIHVMLTGQADFTIRLDSARSISEMKCLIADYISAHARGAGEWYVGTGWSQGELGRYPTRDDIDEISPDAPMILWRECIHIALLNTKALALAAIDDTRVAVSGGSIDRDTNGRATGIVREAEAERVARLLTSTEAQRKEYVVRGLERCLRNGLTTVQTNDEGCWNVYKQLVDQQRLHIRVFLTIMHHEMSAPHQPSANESYGDLLSCHRVKLFADGALGSETAALTQPYADCKHGDAANHGILIHSQSAMTALVSSATSSGFRLEIHVIGDAASKVATTALVEADVPASMRPILTHCQVLSADLLTTMRQRGCIANVQPQFTVTDGRWVEDRLSPSMQQFSYIWKTLMTNDIVVAGGSDSPVELPSALLGMHAAIYRPKQQYQTLLTMKEAIRGFLADPQSANDRLNELYDGCWQARERLSVAEALALYTTNGAYTCGHENSLGKLHAGYLADFVVLSEDIIAQPHALLIAHPTQVWVAGERRFVAD